MKPTLVTLLCAPTGNKLPHRGGRRRKYAYDSLTLEDWATMNNRDIAHRLGAPMPAVEKWRSRHNLPPAPRNKNRQTHDYSNLTLEDWATKSNGEIAKQIGKSRTAVQITVAATASHPHLSAKAAPPAPRATATSSPSSRTTAACPSPVTTWWTRQV